MKLSDLVAYRNELRQVSATAVAQQAHMGLAHILDVASRQQDFQSQVMVLDQQAQVIQSKFDQYKQSLDHLIDQVQSRITQEEKFWFQESYRLYDQEMIHETSEYILDRRAAITAEMQEVLRARLGVRADWQRPGMIIRPGREPWINHLVGLDPLYILDQDLDLLKPAMQHFPEVYQNRLRKYLINERSDQPILRRVPDGQIGVCLAYNFFNFRPMEVIRRYLTEIMTKLRPGGMLAMTFNDCDRHQAVRLAEQRFCCYTPGGLVRDLAQSLGYEITYDMIIDGSTTWLELIRPGEFTTLRGGQAMMRVLPIV